MVATGVSGSSAKRPFAAFVAASTEALRREVRLDARRRGLPAGIEVDDVVQTAYARLLPVYERLDTEFAAYNYAHKTALSALSDARRRDRVRHDGWLETVYRRHHRTGADPEEEALRALRAADVRRAFGRLPLSQRRALALVDVEELRQADAADLLGVSATTLKGLVQRGRARLRQDLLEVPGLAVLFRLKRSALAPAAVAPGVAMMAALVLTVAHVPGVPAEAPYVRVEAAQPAGRAAATADAVQTAVAVAPAARPATRSTRPAKTHRAAPAETPPEPGKKLPDPDPDAGACVGDDTCVGQLVGDEVCVDSSVAESVCVAQAVVGVCPATAPLHPVVTCRRDTKPMVDPLARVVGKDVRS